MKDLEHYPAWLTKLLVPPKKPADMLSMLSMQDNDHFVMDYKDLKYLQKKT